MKSIISLLLAFFIQLSSVSALINPKSTSVESADIHSPNEIVNVLVELEASPLLEGISSMSQRDKLLDNFAESSKYKNILSVQSKLKSKIVSKFKTADFSTSYSYTFVMNGFSMMLPYKYVDDVKKLSGVKSVQLSQSYNQCDTTELEGIVTALGSDTMHGEGELTGVNDAHLAGFTGEGMIVAVLDSSFELGHEAFASNVKNPRLSKKDVNLISAFKCLNTIYPSFSHYINEKIPYRWDYSEVNKGVYSPNSDHGTHVAGIIGGNCEKLKGVAPDCQLLMMKIFKDAAGSTAEEAVTLAALDDAVKLGADVCNLSLSSPSGEEPTDPLYSLVIKRLENVGICVVCSASNDASLGENDSTPGSNTVSTDLFDYGTVGSPSTYTWCMSVASSRIYSKTSMHPDSVNAFGVGSAMMSSFSSWGPSADLRLKPEITAPGSNILSSISNNSYDYFSGTSMSAPYYTGCYALVKQYLASRFTKICKKQNAELINSVLMSTAKAFQAYGSATVYSPRQQGAGFVNMNGALNTKAYLTDINGNRPKIELGEVSGDELIMEFALHNMSEEMLSFTPVVQALTDSYGTVSGMQVNTLSARELKSSEYDVQWLEGVGNDGKITLAPGGQTKIKLVLTISESVANELSAVFKNGFYLDGFVKLQSESEPELSIPYLAFTGDWSAGQLFDNTMYSGKAAYMNRQWGLYVTDGSSYYPLGANIFESMTEYDIDTKYCAYSENALSSSMSKPYVTVCIGALRNTKFVDYSLFTKNGIFRYCGTTVPSYERKTVNPQKPIEGVLWGGKRGLINGHEYVYNISTYAEDYHSGKQSLSFGFVVDNNAPTFESVQFDAGTLKVTIKENHFLQGVRIMDNNGQKIADVSFKGVNPVDGIYEYKMPIEGTYSSLRLYTLDYAYNEAFAEVTSSGEVLDNTFNVDAAASLKQSFSPANFAVDTTDNFNVSQTVLDRIIGKLSSALDEYSKN